MLRLLDESLTDLYERDETAWLDAMARIIREGRFDELDYSHLGEYLEDMASRDRREVESRLAVLIAHLLKWTYQPRRRGKSWRKTIEVQRQKLTLLLESGALANHAAAILERAYASGVRQAIADTDLPKKSLPASCPFTIAQLLCVENGD